MKLNLFAVVAAVVLGIAFAGSLGWLGLNVQDWTIGGLFALALAFAFPIRIDLP